MAQRSPPRSSTGDAAQRWQTVLQNRIPLAGGWLRVQSTLALIRLSISGDFVATRILAQALDNHTDVNIRQMVRRHLSSALPADVLNVVWQVWADSRGPGLAALLLALNRPASTPPDLRLISALFLNLEGVAQEINPAQVPTLYAACSDPDATIASRARFAITRLAKEDSIMILSQLWAQKRDPLLESALAQAAYQPMQPAEVSVLVSLKFNRLELVTRRGPDGIPTLRAACQDVDEEISTRARFCLHNLQSQPSINAVCAAWLEERDPLLESAIIQSRYVASQPARLRLYSALKAGRTDLTEKARPDGVMVLLEACNDADEEIQTRAQTTLRALRSTEAQEALCRAVIEQEHILAKQICFDGGYLPAQPEQRALFLFITEQWDQYESLDFDQRLLNAVYETSSPELRQRILRRVQQAGRTSFLNIVTGTDDRTRAARMSSIEAQLLVRVLSNNAEWERLWGLAQALALPLSVEIVRLLGQKNWQPREPLEQGIFAALTRLAGGEMLYTGSELNQALPVAVPRAVLRVHGRVNGIAFAPSVPHLAIGSGGRRVAVWNYQNACMQTMWKDFPHAIGEVTYTPGGQLLCAERSAQAESCAIYALTGGEPRLIGSHTASVTVLEALDEHTVLSAGRDSRAALWNIAGRSLLREQRLTDWPRAACLSPDRDRLLLLHRSLEMLDSHTFGSLLTFSPARFNGTGRSILRSAAFLPETDQMLAGQFNGQVIHYQHGGNRVRARLMTQHPKPVECILVLPQRPAVATAGAEGQVRIFTLPGLQPFGQIDAPGGRLTSLHASPDGSFLATGSNQSSLTLWDLRVQDIPALFNTPVANILPSQMALVNTLCGYSELLPMPVIHALRYLQTLLQHRFRYDIELSEVPSIKVGEFDVFLD